MRNKFKLLEEVVEEGRELPGGEPQPEDDGSAKWAEFLSQDDDAEEPADLEDEEQPPQETETEATPPAESKPVEETPAVKPDQEQPAAPVAAPVQPQLPPEELAKYREQFQGALEKSYAFSDEEATALQIEPEKVLPKMAARLHMEVLDNVMQHVYNAMPGVIQQYTVATSREEKAQTEFFGAWPELKGHDSQVLQMGQMYRQMNPTASPQEAIQRIGEMTMAALGMKRVEQAQQQQPAAPQTPFRPAAPGRVGTPPPIKGKWDEFLDDDE